MCVPTGIYAATWYTLGACVAYGTVLLLRKGSPATANRAANTVLKNKKNL